MNFAEDPVLRRAAEDRKRTQDETKHFLETRRWLKDHGLYRDGMTTAESKKAMADYRAKISRAQRAGNRDWAYAILSRHADNDPQINAYLLDLAKKAIGHVEVTG